MIRPFFTLIFLLVSMMLRAQSTENASCYFVGHSLVNFDMPAMVHQLAESAGKGSDYAAQIIIGSPLKWNYENPGSAQGTPYTTALPTGNYSHMIVTEAVPLLNHTAWSETYAKANDFLTYARTYRPDIRYYIYETWHCINTGIGEGCPYDADASLLWQPRLVNDFAKWAKIVDSVRILQNYSDVYMVPAGQAFYRLSQEIDQDNVPGITSFRDLFSDDIHLTLTGNYFVACVMYAAIYGESPEGLTNEIYDDYDNLKLAVPLALAEKLQAVAWQEVCENPYSGVNCVITAMENIVRNQAVSIYPQPATSAFTLELPGEQPAGFTLSNNLGTVVIRGNLNGGKSTIATGTLSPGIYILTINQGREVFSKKVSIR